MTTKQEMIRAIEDLPDDASWEDAIERLYLLYKIERGIADADAGRTVPHEVVVERMRQWFR